MSCPCDEFSFPPVRDVTAGLDGETLRHARMLGAFPQWRRAVLDSIAKRPVLDDWRAREEHDLGLMLVEMGAVVFDGIAFYNALINAESYLRTAQFEGAQRKLVQVLGYRPRPAIAAEVSIMAQADGVRVVDVPAGAAFRTAGFSATVNGVTKMQPPQVFELEQMTQIDPRINQMTVARVTQTAVPASISKLLAQPSSVRLQTGQAVVLEFGSTLVAAKVSGIHAERLRSKTLALRIDFSAAVSVPPGSTWAQTRVLSPGATTGLWKLAAQAGETAVVSGATLLLDGRVAIVAGTVVLCEYGTEFAVRRVTATTDEMRILLPQQTSTIGSGSDAKTLTSPPIKIAVTRITLDSALPWSSIATDQLVLRHAMSIAALPLAPIKNTLEQGDLVSLPDLLDAPRTDASTVALEDAHGIGVVGGGAFDATEQTATLAATPAWSEPLMAPVKLYGNVLRVSRGETVADEQLGIGDAAQEQQMFTLKKKPLTYLNAAGGNGRRSTLSVRVAGVLWREVPTFYGIDRDQQVYTVRHDEAGETFITFGGAARLPTGVVVTADYRFGAGAAMPPAGALSQLAKPLPGVRGVRNVSGASGGADAESSDALAKYAPRTALLLNRAISLPDLEALAAQTSNIVAARAAWQWDAQGLRPAAAVGYITSAPDGDASAVDGALLARLRAAMEDDAPVSVQRSMPQPAALKMALTIDPRYVGDTVTWQAREALFSAATETSAGGMLQPAQLGPDGILFLSRLVAVVMAVEGVTGVASVWLDGIAFTAAGVAPAGGHYFDFTDERGGSVAVTVNA